MSESINSTIKNEELLAAGEYAQGPFSALSPFHFVSDEAGKEPPSTLVSKGELIGQYKPAFQTLAKTTRIGAVAFFSTDVLMDTSFYYPADGSSAVSLSLVEDGIQLQSPANALTALDWLAQRIGASVLRSTTLDIELSLEEARAFFGVLDAARRSMLFEMIEMGNAEAKGVTRKDAIAALTEEFDDLQWLAPHFAKSYDMPAVSAEKAEQLIMRLAQKGFVVLDGDRIDLSDALMDIVSDYLLVNCHLRLRKAALDEKDRIATTELRGIQGRGSAMMLWSDEEKTIHLKGVSPAQVMRIAREILGQTEEYEVEEMAEKIPESSTKLDRKAARHAKRTANGKKRRRWWLIPLILIAIVAVIIFLLWFFA